MAFEQKQFLSAVEQLTDEKGISKESVIETVEAALAAAYKRDYAKRGQHIRVQLDEESGNMNVFLQREVVAVDPETNTITEMAPKEQEDAEESASSTTASVPAPASSSSDSESEGTDDDEEEYQREYNPDRYISLEEAADHLDTPALGDVVETSLEPPSDFGRIAAQTAKQVIIQRIREAERQAMFDEYSDKVGQVINGTVQRAEGRKVIIDLGQATGVLFPDEQIPREFYTPGQRIKVYLKAVEHSSRGPGITLSRACPEFVGELFKMEVPEINSGAVEVKGVAREAGSRTKIAVHANEEGIDPVGACVGQKGVRIQTLIAELNGEKIDVIEWVDDTEKYIMRALSPAKVLSVEILDADAKEVRAIVEQDQLSLAIGRQGQNVRLAAKLTGWSIDVRSPESLEDTPASSSDDAESPDAESTEETNVPATPAKDEGAPNSDDDAKDSTSSAAEQK